MSEHTKDFLMPELTPNTARSSWSAERSALAADVLRRSGYLRLRVYGESMLPTLWPGDEVEIASCSLEDLRPGEIVLAEREGRFFLHRLVGRTSNSFLLRGDSVPGTDPQFAPEALLGRLVRTTTGARWTLAAAPSRAVGLLLCYSGIARRLALRVHHRRASVRACRSLGAF